MIFRQKQEMLFIAFFILFFLLLYLIPFGVFGGDGYLLGYPVVAEFLKGNADYLRSSVIFDGQNLLSIYGDLPFWYILRALKSPIHTVLNITYWFHALILFLITLRIFKGLKTNHTFVDLILLSTYCLLSPIITNRVMAGHINLLFGLLPFLISLALIFNKSIFSIIIYITGLWFCFNLQTYQMLAYHFFYIPIWFYFFRFHETEKKKYFLYILFILVISFLLGFRNFYSMFTQANSSDSLRTIHQNMVYSYLTSSWAGFFQLFLNQNNFGIWKVNESLYHEFNYSVGAFAFLIFLIRKKDRFPLYISILTIILFLFCMNLPGFNLLSDLPFIKPFRVPQRSLIFACFIIPVWCLAKNDQKIPAYFLPIWLIVLIITQFVPCFDLVAIFVILLIYFIPKFNRNGLVILVAFAGLFSGTHERIVNVMTLSETYLEVRKALLPIKNSFSPKELSETKFHFETRDPVLVNSAAHSLGIPTVEGYGFPPKSFFIRAYKDISNLPLGMAQFHLFPDMKNYKELLKEFNIQKIVTFDSSNKPITRDVNSTEKNKE